MTSRVRYRVAQFRRTLSPRVADEERREAEAVLGSLYPLFAAMQAADQRHCLDVYQLLRADAETDTELLTAALIHDAGKAGEGSARVRLWHRALLVILPDALVRRFARGDGGFARLHRHGEQTLLLAREAGAPDAVIELLSAMETHSPYDARAARLVAADNAC
ncbi:MAG: HD domain-containing protein [Dehalococcoidia bacterium]